MADIYWSWVERVVERVIKRIQLDYRLVPIMIGVSLLIIYLYVILTNHVSFPYDKYNLTIVISTVLFYAIAPSGIMYFLRRIREITKMLFLDNTSHMELDSLMQNLNNRFTRENFFKVVLIFTVVPIIVIDIYGIRTEKIIIFWQIEQTTSILIFTIFYYLIGYSINIFLATIIWIMINISWFLNKLTDENILNEININIFQGFQLGLLSQLKNLLLTFTIYYFICVAFAILSYVSPAHPISYQMLFYAFIDILGILIFLFGWWSIKEIFRRKWQIKAAEIDELYINNHRELMNLLSKDNENEEKLKRLASALEVIQKQRDILTQIVRDFGGALDLIKVSGSFLLTLLAFAQKFFDAFSQFILLMK